MDVLPRLDSFRDDVYAGLRPATFRAAMRRRSTAADVDTLSPTPMTTSIAGEYRDRTTGLIVFGILEIALGALFLLMVPLVLLSLTMARRQGGVPVEPLSLIPAIGFYVLSGTVLGWLGIGSILGRRWARALWVCLSGGGLAVGVIACPFVLYMASSFPEMLASSGQQTLPPAALLVARVVMVGFMLLFYIFIPGVLFLFYRSPHVKRTCEVRDPKERWTDRCPLPVLALSLFTAFSALGTLMLLAFRCVFPVFGMLLTGAAGCSVILVISGTMLYLGWGLYRLRINAWRVFAVMMVLMAVSGAVTFWHIDFLTLYAKMGFNSHTTTMAAQMGNLPLIRWMGLVSMLPWLVWLLYVRRYFPRTDSAADGAPV